MSKRQTNIFTILTAAVLMAVFGAVGIFSSGTASAASSATYRVVATDGNSGDTLYVLGNGQFLKVRLIGIDAPEASSRANTKVGCYGSQARKVLNQLVLNKNVTLRSDPNVPDKYTDGSLMRYVRTPEGWDVGGSMIKSGAAKEYMYARKTYAYRSHYRELKTAAYNANKGMWNKKTCPMNR